MIQVRTKYVVLGGAMIGVLTLTAGACSGDSSGKQSETAQQDAISKTLINNQPLPAFNWSQLRQNLIEIETAQAQGVQTTTFFFNQGVQDPISSCPSIGAPIPTTDQLSNPTKIEHHGETGGGNITTNQMEPNGTYTGDSAGTYVMCVNAQGKAYATYWEGYVQTIFGDATWDKATHQVELKGDPSFKFTKSK